MRIDGYDTPIDLVASVTVGNGEVLVDLLDGQARSFQVTQLRALDDNLDTLELRERSKVLSSDALSVASILDADIVFADPPYDFEAWPEFLGRVRADVVVIESGADIDPPVGWTITRSKKYGRTRVTFLEREVTSGATPPK